MASAATRSSALFEPLEIRGIEFRNRIVMAPMGSCQSDHDGFVTDQTVEYYRRRARGGVGGITVEAALVTPEANGHEPRLHDAKYVPGMRRVVEAIRDNGAAVGIQLMHPGRQVTSGRAVAASAVPLNSAAPVPEVLTVDEIGEIVERYATTARLAQEAGFEYVEVHGAHGYLPSDFLSPVVNLRDDAYGGTLEKRARFTLEVAEAIIAATDIPVFWRLSGAELTEGGYDLEQQLVVARRLEDAGVACISVSAGTWHRLDVTVAPMWVQRGHMVHYAAAVKEAVNVPVIAVGRLDDPALAERVVREGSADLVLIGRGLIADPDWTVKLEQERRDEIRPCIACNACVDLVGRGLEMRCAVNPETGHELTWHVERAPASRRVMVVGSGPAGMEAARLAAARGHAVTLWERDDRIGGKLDVASRAPSKSEVLRYRDYQSKTLADLGVAIHTGVEVMPELVERERPDAVIVATGADPLFPPIPGVDGPTVVDAQEILYGRIDVGPDARVVVVGGSATGCETAELLLSLGADVTIVEMVASIGKGIEQITRRHLVRSLRKGGVHVVTDARVVSIEPDRVRYQPVAGGAEVSLDADLVALAVGWRASGHALAEALAGREVHVVGDAEQPADFVAAVAAGAAAGRAV